MAVSPAGDIKTTLIPLYLFVIVEICGIVRGMSDETRLALLRVAEKLFATQGVDAVSLREVAAEANQRNVSAVHYHFGSRLELLERALERHAEGIQQRLSDELTDETKRPARHWVSRLVRLLAEKMRDPDGGDYYIWLCAQLCASKGYPLAKRRVSNTETNTEFMAKLSSFAPSVSPGANTLRWKRFASMLYLSLGDYLSARGDKHKVDEEAFLEDLVDSLVRVVELDTSRLA